MLTPSRASISARRRAIVQLGRLATGSSSNGVTTRKAVSLFTGGGPGATLAFKRIDATAAEIAAPQPHRVLPHAERFGDARTGPTRKRQQDCACSVRLAAITRASKGRQGGTLIIARQNRGLAAHAAPLRIDGYSESYARPLVKLWESA